MEFTIYGNQGKGGKLNPLTIMFDPDPDYLGQAGLDFPSYRLLQPLGPLGGTICGWMPPLYYYIMIIIILLLYNINLIIIIIMTEFLSYAMIAYTSMHGHASLAPCMEHLH